MQFKQILGASLIAAASAAEYAAPPAYETGKLGDAAAIYDNPADCVYEAVFTGKAEGKFIFKAGDYGKGVKVSVEVSGLTDYTGPYGYHIHDSPIDASGDCATALAHLDPYQRGQATPCDATKPETCEVGDLSGKHGKIESCPYKTEYVDLYASIKPGIGAYLGNRSIVIHANDEKKTRIACANIYPVKDAVKDKDYGHGKDYDHDVKKGGDYDVKKGGEYDVKKGGDYDHGKGGKDYDVKKGGEYVDEEDCDEDDYYTDDEDCEEEEDVYVPGKDYGKGPKPPVTTGYPVPPTKDYDHGKGGKDYDHSKTPVPPTKDYGHGYPPKNVTGGKDYDHKGGKDYVPPKQYTGAASSFGVSMVAGAAALIAFAAAF